MSFAIDIDSLEEREKLEICKRCTLESKTDIYSRTPITLRLFHIDKHEFLLPLGLWEEYYEDFPNIYVNHSSIKDSTFKGQLRSSVSQDQSIICSQALETLKSKHSVLLELYTGFGKTICGIWLILKLKLKTLVVCPIRTLHPQWKDRIENFTNLKVQIVKGKQLDPKADIYIMGAKKAGNFKYFDFINIGTLVIDEIEHICTKTFSTFLQKVRPQFLIGCSATPDRVDGLDIALKLYFPFPFLFRDKVKNFTVIKFKSSFEPEIRSNRRGDLDWTHLQNSLSYNTERHNTICELIERYCKDHRIVVMAKRIDEIDAIYNKLRSKSITVDYVTQNKNKWDDSCSVLIGTFSKIGVGLDVTDRDITILAGDVKDIRQPEGRIRLSNNTIVDIVDDHSTLERHWQQRRKWYLQRGAQIQYENCSASSKTNSKKEEWLLPSN